MSDRVLIVGGGVAGLSLANALATRGISSRVLERSAKRGVIDRGDVIHAGALALLRQWGVLTHLAPEHVLTVELAAQILFCKIAEGQTEGGLRLSMLR